MNYSMDEYARKVVEAMKEICTELGATEPNIITESGRAMTAHHAVLLTEIIDHERSSDGELATLEEDDPACLKGLHRAYEILLESRSSSGLVEQFHDVQHWVAEANTAFSLGLLSLPQRASTETLYTRCCQLLMDKLTPANRSHRPLIDELQEKLADKVFVNFSLFQSLPDIWGIEQIFPILPVSGHDQPMNFRGVLQDITCDSDGRIDTYVESEGLSTSLPMPSIQRGDLMAFFMVGAYQEILGDLHNLFGDTDSVDVVMDSNGEPQLRNPVWGDHIAKVLGYVNFDADDIRHRLMSQVAQSQLTSEDKALFQRELSESLQAYTYLQL